MGATRELAAMIDRMDALLTRIQSQQPLKRAGGPMRKPGDHDVAGELRGDDRGKE